MRTIAKTSAAIRKLQWIEILIVPSATPGMARRSHNSGAMALRITGFPGYGEKVKAKFANQGPV